MKKVLCSLALLSMAGIDAAELCPIGSAKGLKNTPFHKGIEDDFFFEEPPYLPQIPAEIAWTGPSEDEKIIVSKIKGVILAGREESIRPKGWHKAIGLQSVDLDIPGGLAGLQKRLEPLFLNEPLTEGLLISLKKEIYSYFEEHHRPLVSVAMPEQDVKQGVIQLVVAESKLGTIQCRGNRHYHCSLLKKYIGIKPGDAVRTDLLLQDAAFMNRSPYRKINIAFASGKEEKTTDIVLITKDRFPFGLWAGGDNTGTKGTGNARLFGGLTWGNVFNLDHAFSYQYTRSAKIEEFQSHTFRYSVPTSWHHNIIAYGGFANAHPNLSEAKHARGFSSQASLRYEIPVGKLWDSYLHQLVFGFDYKHTNNNLETEEEPIIFKSVNLTQFLAGYTYDMRDAKNKLQLQFDLYFSPGQIMGGGSDSAFNNARKHAKNSYAYGRFSCSELFHMPRGWDLFGMLRWQAASGVLFPSEQFGLGGYNTVRGYKERQYNSDNMVLANVEVRTPALSIFRWFGNRRGTDSLYFLSFLDYAKAWNYASPGDHRQNEWLLGAGAGLRYRIGRYFTARADWGFKLHKDSIVGRHIGKGHIGINASY